MLLMRIPKKRKSTEREELNTIQFRADWVTYWRRRFRKCRTKKDYQESVELLLPALEEISEEVSMQAQFDFDKDETGS